MNKILSSLRQELRSIADEKLRLSAQRFFKEKIKSYGTKTADISKLAKKTFKKMTSQQKEDVFALCEKLWQSGYLEESFIACDWTYAVRKQYQTQDLDLFEEWIEKYIKNWASCDTFCNHSVGALISDFPQEIRRLKIWAKSKNLWLRRAAAVSLIVPVRQGFFLKDAFALADILLKDHEDLVQKGYGWLLKVASQKHQLEVFDYVMKNKKAMPRTALRYAIEKMPSELKKQAMLKDW